MPGSSHWSQLLYAAHGGAAGPLDDSLDVLLSQGRESLLRASQDTVAAEVVDVESELPTANAG